MNPLANPNFLGGTGLVSPACSALPRKERGEEGEEESEKGQRERKAAFVFTPQSDVGWRWGGRTAFFAVYVSSAVEI